MCRAKILHVVNSFDPSADVVRCVRELNKYSRYEHKLFVKDEHPGQYKYGFEQAPELGNESRRAELLRWCDAIIYEFAGWEGGNDEPSKPAAFRNINIYWNSETAKFWSHPSYNARPSSRYTLYASSHIGAKDFLPADRFRWLPDLLPLDGEYVPDFRDREPCISFIKHADEIRQMPTAVKKLSLDGKPHPEILKRRKESTVAIDNVCDGHWGLAGHEALTMGLPVVVYNHPRTTESLIELIGSDVGIPFYKATSVQRAVDVASDLATDRHILDLQKASRDWAEKHFAPDKLIQKTWDPFCDELIGA